MELHALIHALYVPQGAKGCVGAVEKKLRKYSIAPVENFLWDHPFCDAYQDTCLVDMLHTGRLGLYHDGVTWTFTVLKALFPQPAGVYNTMEALIDERMMNVAPWQGGRVSALAQ